MIVSFNKYHGTGNDFILIDNRKKLFKANTKTIQHLCDRHFGIGADGLMLLQNKNGFDFEMVYYNSDGIEGSMCGNGGRCLVAFAKHLGIIKDKAHFIATDGEHIANIILSKKTLAGNIYVPSEIVKLKMSDIQSTELIQKKYFINTGSPHYIVFVKDVEKIDVFREGKKLRYSKPFHPTGTNVNFVEEMKGYLFVRTYERGVEDETFSCGTGVTASALAYVLKNTLNIKKIDIKTKGGQLKVYFKKEKKLFKDIWLEGPATLVYSGILEI